MWAIQKTKQLYITRVKQLATDDKRIEDVVVLAPVSLRDAQQEVLKNRAV